VKIFLDTNVLVSAYTARGISNDLMRFILAEHELLTGEVNLTELRRVLRERFRASRDQADTIEAELRAETVVPKPPAPSDLPIRDPELRSIPGTDGRQRECPTLSPDSFGSYWPLSPARPDSRRDCSPRRRS
jgi:hypothetical protein